MNIERCLPVMADIFKLIWGAIVRFFRPRVDREAEIIALRHQLNVLRWKRPERLVFSNADRLLFVWLYRLRSRVQLLAAYRVSVKAPSLPAPCSADRTLSADQFDR